MPGREESHLTVPTEMMARRSHGLSGAREIRATVLTSPQRRGELQLKLTIIERKIQLWLSRQAQLCCGEIFISVKKKIIDDRKQILFYR